MKPISLLNCHVEKKDFVLFVLFSLLTFYIPFNDYGCTRNQLIGVVLVVIAYFSSIKVNAMQIAFFASYIAATVYSLFGFPLHIITLLEGLFFYRIIRSLGMEPSEIKFVVGLVIYEAIAIVAFGMSMGDLVKLLFNVFLFLFFVKILKYHGSYINLVYFAYAMGVFSSCIAGQYYVPPASDDVFDDSIYWLRYCGLWTDPNFFGCFCLTAILSLYKLDFKNIYLNILKYVLCVIIYSYGMMSLSRTYLLVTAIMLIVYIYRTFKSQRVSVFTVICVIIGGTYALLRYMDNLTNNRVVHGDSATGGRIDLTTGLLKGWFSDVCVYTGAGFNNWKYLTSLAGNSHASHNTYADFLLQFGLYGILTIIVAYYTHTQMAKSMLRSLTEIYGLPMLCTLICIFTLSATKYEFVYFMAALFYIEYKKHNKIVVR